MRVLVTRPEPAASRTAARLTALGHDPIVVPLMAPHALDWRVPPGDWQAVAFTSALAPGLGGAGLAGLTGLPAYAVGTATADAAHTAGFTDVRTSDDDASRLFARAGADGIARLLHLTAPERSAAAVPPGLTVGACEIYTTDLAPALPAAAATADLTLLYSARTARHFAALVDAADLDRSTRAIGVLSLAVAAAAGSGWRSVAVADVPTEDALFAATGLTCERPR